MMASKDTICIQGGWQPKSGDTAYSADLSEYDL